MTILVTGGAGFIGSHFVREWIAEKKTLCINLDKLTYAGNLHNLDTISNPSLHYFVKGDIGDRSLVGKLLEQHQPVAVVHLAAETHVDRSIDDPTTFIQTNVTASYAFLEEVFRYWKGLDADKKTIFRFLNVSAAEVYGSLEANETPCIEGHAFRPTTPYAASKAAFDHLIHSYCVTYGFPGLNVFSSNIFGSHQFPENFIPLTIVNAMKGKPLPLYGDGLQSRNWLYVKDLCAGLRLVLDQGKTGEVYNIAYKKEISNLQLVTHICVLLDALLTESRHRPHTSLITHIPERHGHDRRYALNCSKIETQLGWRPQHTLDESLLKTIIWYLDHRDWVENVLSGSYRTWVHT